VNLFQNQPPPKKKIKKIRHLVNFIQFSLFSLFFLVFSHLSLQIFILFCIKQSYLNNGFSSLFFFCYFTVFCADYCVVSKKSKGKEPKPKVVVPAKRKAPGAAGPSTSASTSAAAPTAPAASSEEKLEILKYVFLLFLF